MPGIESDHVSLQMQFFLECCKLNGSCERIKTSPQLLDDTPDTNPNYCYMHGLLCSQCVPA